MNLINFFSENFTVFLWTVTLVSLLIGSFLNVVIYRLPQIIMNSWSAECREYLGLKTQAHDIDRINLWLPLSHCIQCKKPLKPWHNIPILSYLVLKGKCAYCHAKISARYPLVELICCLTSVYVAWRFGVTSQ